METNMSKEKVLKKLVELSNSDKWGIDENNDYFMTISDPDPTVSKSFRIYVLEDTVVFKRDTTVLFFTKDQKTFDAVKKNAEECMISRTIGFVMEL